MLLEGLLEMHQWSYFHKMWLYKVAIEASWFVRGSGGAVSALPGSSNTASPRTGGEPLTETVTWPHTSPPPHARDRPDTGRRHISLCPAADPSRRPLPQWGVTSFRNELRLPLPHPCTTTTDGALRTCKQVNPPINLNRQLRAERLVGGKKKEKLRDVWEERGWRSASLLHVSSRRRHSLRQWKIERAVYLCAPNGGEPDG